LFTKVNFCALANEVVQIKLNELETSQVVTS